MFVSGSNEMGQLGNNNLIIMIMSSFFSLISFILIFFLSGTGEKGTSLLTPHMIVDGDLAGKRVVDFACGGVHMLAIDSDSQVLIMLLLLFVDVVVDVVVVGGCVSFRFPFFIPFLPFFLFSLSFLGLHMGKWR